MRLETLEDLFIEQIRDVYDPEKQLVRTLPKMAVAAHSDGLQNAIREHSAQTGKHVARLERVFAAFGEEPKGKSSKAMRGLLEEAGEVMCEAAVDPLSDLAMIAAAQKVEHYEISAYGTARALAEQLGNREAALLLKQTLEEEKEDDRRLTEIAEFLIQEAVAESKI